MNWVERMYEIKGKDPYSQNGEGIILEYIISRLQIKKGDLDLIDIGGGDGFYLSNTRYLAQLFNLKSLVIDKEDGQFVTRENILGYFYTSNGCLISIDIDGNDYWIIDRLMQQAKPAIIIAEFNPAFTDSRTIKYNPDHVWDGTDYYGFSFEAGKKLAFIHGYKVIFQIANMNMIMVRHDLISPNISIPEVKYEQVDFFKKSNREDWVFV